VAPETPFFPPKPTGPAPTKVLPAQPSWPGTYDLVVIGLLGQPLPQSSLVVQAPAKGSPLLPVNRTVGGGTIETWGLTNGHLLTVAHGPGNGVGVAQLTPEKGHLVGTYYDAYGHLGVMTIKGAAQPPSAHDPMMPWRPTGQYEFWVQVAPQPGTGYDMSYGGTVVFEHNGEVTQLRFWPNAEEDYYVYGVGFAVEGVWNLALCSDPGPVPMAVGPNWPRVTSPGQQPADTFPEEVRNPMQPYSSVGFGVSVYKWPQGGGKVAIAGWWAPNGHNTLQPETLTPQ